MNSQTAELVQDCELAGQKHMLAFPGLQVDCHASSNTSKTKSYVGGKAKAAMLPCIEYQPEQIGQPWSWFVSHLANANYLSN